MKHYKFPPELVFNSDQTPSSNVSVAKSTMAFKGSKAIPIKGNTDKRATTLAKFCCNSIKWILANPSDTQRKNKC